MTTRPAAPAVRRPARGTRPAAGARPADRRPRRRGTVLVVVIALLGALMLLGFLFLTLTLQEEQNSIYFGESAKTVETDPNVLFNEALEQLIVGPDDRRRDSILWGGSKSLMPGMVGADPVPFDGTGVSTVWDGSVVAGGRPAADLNRDGVADDPADPSSKQEAALRMTFAPGSQPEAFGSDAQRAALDTVLRNLRVTAVSGLPTPDIDRTYPDINNAFLSYDWVEPVTGARMILPSFHRPQLLRNRIANGDFTTDPAAWPNPERDPETGANVPVHPWYTDLATLPFVMRPHRERRAVATDPEAPENYFVPQGGGSGETASLRRRYISSLYPDVRVNAAGTALETVGVTDPDYIPPFELRFDREPFWRVGVNDPDLAGGAPYNAAAAYTGDADPDNDGVKDAIWTDLGYPAQPAGDGDGMYVPLFAFTIKDLSSLFHLNAHGNTFGEFADADGDGDVEDDALNLVGRNFTNAGGGAAVGMLSRSDHGLTPDEVNPEYGLSGLNTVPADPQGRTGSGDDFEAFGEFFDSEFFSAPWTGTAQQSRNLEWWFLLHGRTAFADAQRGGGRVPDDVRVGRYGERPRVEAGAEVLHASLTGGTARTDAAAFFPYPGLSAPRGNGQVAAAAAGDDDGDRFAGTAFTLPGLVFGGLQTTGGTFREMITHPEGVPLDRRGSGFYVDAVDGVRRLWLTYVPGSGGGTYLQDPELATPAATASFGLRQRFPLLADALVPLRSAVSGAGFAAAVLSDWALARDWFAGPGVVLRDERADGDGIQVASSAGMAVRVSDPTGSGVPAGLLINQDGPASLVENAGGTFLPSLYGALMGNLGGQALAGLNRLAVDHPAETIRDFAKADGQRSDAIFGPDETVALHLSDRDLQLTGVTGRLLDLVPASFVHAPHAQEVRRRFTTAAFDVTTAAVPFEPPAVRSPTAEERQWEFHTEAADPSLPRTPPRRTFPPTFGSVAAYDPADPFRAEVRALLSQSGRNAELSNLGNPPSPEEEALGDRRLRGLARRISLNGVVERVTNPDDPMYDATVDLNDDGTPDGQGELRIRPLTPHPRGLAAAPVFAPAGHPAGPAGSYAAESGTTPRFGLPDDAPLRDPAAVSLATARAGSPGTGLVTWDFAGGVMSPAQAAQAQEWHARRDRQNLARDIYTLLYTLGGVEPANSKKDYTSVPNAYTPEEAREMAQFAVNVVDAMDEDPVRTAFVYDLDLSDGYTPFDDGYALPPGRAAVDRGMVLGVERQDLALSEVLVNLAWGGKDRDDPTDPRDNKLTEWDDAVPQSFFFAELAYTGPGVLHFGTDPRTGAAPAENWRVIVRDPRDGRQFRPASGAVLQNDSLRDHAVTPRAGYVSAQRPYYTIASADPGIEAFQGADGPRSRIRVNLEEDVSAPSATDQAAWQDLAPRPFDDFVTQNDPAMVLRDTLFDADDSGDRDEVASTLDLLVPGTNTADPTFRLHELALDEDGGMTTGRPLTSPTELDALQFLDVEDAKARPPVVEVLLQTRANPLRGPNDPDPTSGDTVNQERDNPWVTVDRMRAVTTRLDVYEDDTNPADATVGGTFGTHFLADVAYTGPESDRGGLTNKGPKVASRVRRRPLLRASEVAGFRRRSNRGGNADADEQSLLNANENPARQNERTAIFNSLGGHDFNSPQVDAANGPSRPFDLWQPHFDRPFAGPADLTGVPLYDAEHLTGLMSVDDAVFGPSASTGLTLAAGTPDGFLEFTHLAADADRQIGLGYDPTPQNADDTGAGKVAVLNRTAVAGAKLLYPDVKRLPWQARVDGDAANDGPTNARFNMWYRLLQYADTPRHTAEMTSAQPFTVRIAPTAGQDTDAGFDPGEVRRAGAMNLNTLADPVHLAGLLDDLGRTHQFPVGTTGVDVPNGRPRVGLPVDGTLTPAGDEGTLADVGGNRFDGDIYKSLLRSRDGLDPLTPPGRWNLGGGGVTHLVLPGVADRGLAAASSGGRNPHPFAGFLAPTRTLGGGTDADVARVLREAIQATPLRARPQATPWIDAPGATDLSGQSAVDANLPRAFFGVGAVGLETDEDQGRPDVDYTTRYRLLNKVLNSATHRGNTFLCWIQIDYFNAREIAGVIPDDPGTPADESRQVITRVGAKRGDSPGHRGAFLIDRSLALELLRADHLPGTVNPNDSAAPDGDETRTYSFARDPLSGGVKFPWQNLVIHRQRVQ